VHKEDGSGVQRSMHASTRIPQIQHSGVPLQYEPFMLVHGASGTRGGVAFEGDKLLIGGHKLMTLVDVSSGATLCRTVRKGRVRVC